jgi:hypothetical protein
MQLLSVAALDEFTYGYVCELLPFRNLPSNKLYLRVFMCACVCMCVCVDDEPVIQASARRCLTLGRPCRRIPLCRTSV